MWLRAVGGWFLLSSRAVYADEAFVLVTDALAEQERRAQAAGALPPPVPRRRGVYPRLQVLAPDAAGALASPLRLALRFETSADAHIVPGTFRLLYGVMKFDLTETLLRHARVSEQGLVADAAMVPPGTHRLLLQIADDRGRVTEQELRLKVAAG